MGQNWTNWHHNANKWIRMEIFWKLKEPKTDECHNVVWRSHFREPEFPPKFLLQRKRWICGLIFSCSFKPTGFWQILLKHIFLYNKRILLYNKLFCGTKSKSKYLKLKGKWTRSTEAIMCQGHHVGNCSHWKIHCCLQIRTEHCSSHTTADICDNRLTIFHKQHKRVSFKSVC